MVSKLVDVLQRDMKILRYNGESQEDYVGRLVYSALSHWIRYVILDEVTQNKRCKSKSYILRRGQTILENLVESLPVCKNWVYGDSKTIKEQVNPVKVIRERMLSAGELLEVDENGSLGLPTYKKMQLDRNFSRVLGLCESEESYMFVGVTRIQNVQCNGNSIPELKNVEVDSYLNWLYQNVSWQLCSDTELSAYEFFNPYSKKPPYQSWNNRIIKNIQYTLGRLTLFNGMHEYYILKNYKDEWYSSKLATVLVDYREEKRIILGVRQKYGNSMKATYEKRKSVVILNLYCRLPLREQAMLETFCWPLNNWNDYLNYVIPVEVWPMLEHLLKNNLGIELEERV